MLQECKGCGCRYAWDLDACPQCHAPTPERSDDMPKITVHGGPSNAADEQPEPVPTDVEPVEEPEQTATPRPKAPARTKKTSAGGE